MKPAENPRRGIPLAAGSTGLGLLIGMVAAWCLDLPARHLASAPLCLLRWESWKPRLLRVGGLADFLGAFLAQLDRWSWLGTLVLAIEASLLCFAAGLLMRLVGARRQWAAGVPALMLLVLQSQPLAPAAFVMAGIFLTLGSVIAWALPWRRGPSSLRWVLLAALAVALWQAAGPFSCLLFLILSGQLAWIRERDGRLALGCVVALVPWTMAFLRLDHLSLEVRALHWGGKAPLVLAGLWYLSFPLLLAFGQRSQPQAPANASAGPDRARADIARRETRISRWSQVRNALPNGLQVTLLGAAIVGFFASWDRALWDRLRIQSAAEDKDWPRVLAVARRMGWIPVSAQLQLHRALFRLGRLNAELFAYPVVEGADMLASLTDGLDVSLPLCDTFLELGHVSQAEHYVQEAVESRGESPALLWRLAVINVVKARPKAARVFLNRLSRIPFHAEESRRWLEELDRDPTLARFEQVAQVRARAVGSDWIERRFASDRLLKQSLELNPTNRMAAEYLMAQWLLARQPERILRDLPSLLPDRSAPLPKNVAEALLIAVQLDPSKAAELTGRTIDAELERRFSRFRQESEGLRQGQDRVALESALAAEFGDTYWFYHVFGRTGAALRAAQH